MLRSLTSSGLKQTQRVSTKSKSKSKSSSSNSNNTNSQPNIINHAFNYNNSVIFTPIPASSCSPGATPSASYHNSHYNTQHHHSKFYSTATPQISDNYSKLLALFDECLAQNSTYDLATGKINGHNNNPNQFWLAIKKILPIYRSLLQSGYLNEKRMSDFVSLLRNGLRIHRFELSKLNKNLDKDSTNPIKNIHYILTCAIREVSQNLLDGLIRLNSHGLTHLFKAYKDLGFTYEAVQIWETGRKNPNLMSTFTSEPVLGSIFPFLVENGDFDFNEIWAMYSNVKNLKPGEKLHNELQIGMIRVCLFKDKVNDALEIFNKLTNDIYEDNMNPPINIKSYLTMAHLSFIGFSKDINTADYFFQNAVNESMPYLTPLQLNFIKKYLINIYSLTGDYEKCKNIWLITWNYYELKKTSNSSISSSLNDTFLTIFFKHFPQCNAESFNELKTVINHYQSVKSIDEPFINVLLSKSTCWNNLEVFEHILSTSNSNNFVKTNVFYRCCLKACGSININISNILIIFRQLLTINASNNMKFIAHADWIALRDATINSPIVLNSNNEQLINDRIDLYFKLFKICSVSFINLENFKNYILKDIKLNYNYSKIFEQLSIININDIEIPEINLFKENNAIKNYILNTNTNEKQRQSIVNFNSNNTLNDFIPLDTY